MKIIFLDIDGVLNVIPVDRDEFGGLFHRHFEDNLRYVIEQTGAKIVISSTWKADGLDVMQAMWKHRGLAGEVINVTPYEVDVVETGVCEYYDEVDRGFEIQQYLNEHKDEVENYCIIDDCTDMLPSQMDNFVQTSGNSDHPDCIDIGYGLTRICAEKVVEILNRK